MNATINQIIVAVQSELTSAIPAWNTKDEYAAYMQAEQQVAETIRNLDALLQNAANSGASVNTLKTLTVNFLNQ